MKIPPRYVIEDDDMDLLYRFTAWMEAVVDHASADYCRRHKNQKKECSLEQIPESFLSYEDQPPESSNEFELENDNLSKSFTELNLLRRQILTLAYIEGLSAQEIADRLNYSVDYVYLQKHRALKKLRDQLIEEGDSHGKHE